MILIQKHIITLFLTIYLFSGCYATENKTPVTGELDKLRHAFLNLGGDSKQALPVYHAFLKQKKSDAVTKAYIGTLESILADQQGNPFSKLSWFNKGKKKIEEAVNESPKNPEIRFLRLSVQANAPSFLFYNSNIEEDKKIVIDNLDYFEKIGTKKEIISFLKTNVELTNEELQKIES